MSDAAAVSVPLGKFAAAGETQVRLGRGSMVFLGGMAVAAISFFVERAVVRAIREL